MGLVLEDKANRCFAELVEAPLLGVRGRESTNSQRTALGTFLFLRIKGWRHRFYDSVLESDVERNCGREEVDT